jgi:hypothetical protein
VARRSPQEKKALSYAKDRRNDYGENRLRRRVRLGMEDPSTAGARIERVRRRRVGK